MLLSDDEWKSIRKTTKSMPEFVSAKPFHNGPDMFIYYAKKYYYQDSMSYLYKLASLQRIKFKGKKITKWKDSQGIKWLNQIDPDELINGTVC